jgi:long-chain acyl-CoA synthetase
VSDASIAEITDELTGPGMPLELETIIIRGVPTRWWKRLPKTVPELVRSSFHEFRERDYLVYEDERLSYAQAFARIATLAHHLRDECGVAPGDRVSLAMRNYPEWAISFWATLCTGAIVVPLNAWWKGGELAYGLSDSGSRVLICDQERADVLSSHLPALRIEHLLVTRSRADSENAAIAGARPLEAVFAGPLRDALPALQIYGEDDATIFYTSGTTGRPKGALGTHRNLCANVGSALFTKARSAARNGRPSLPPTTQSVALLSVPLFHVTGSHSSLAAGTYNGNKIVMMHKWQPERALQLIERERITQFGGVPSMVWQVLESPDFAKRDTSSIAAVGYGGAPAAPELVRRIKQAFPTSSPSNGYGLTETSALTTSNAGVDYERKPDSVGVPIAACELMIVDADGRELPTESVGELWVKGPNVVKGYWRNPEATAKSFSSGWLHTGDIARLDSEGFLYVLDRAKDMLIRGGENVYCVEVEDVLYSHPSVMDAAVLGIPHRVLGEEVGAVVQLAPGMQVDAAQLQAYTAQRLAGFKVPVRIEIRAEPLPRNANGKIMKRDLKRELGWE